MSAASHRMSRRTEPLAGRFRVPGDKSLSHRAVLFAAMAEGDSRVSGVLDSADIRSTIDVVTALGARVDLAEGVDGTLEGRVTGWGSEGARTPARDLYCGNSGTTARLLMGVLAGSGVSAVITGDDSLSSRPMRRVTDPLTRMGASLKTAEGGTLPVRVDAAGEVQPGEFNLTVASAQVKSAILLAGLNASGRTSVTEPSLSRDHTERMLPLFGVEVERDGLTVHIDGPAHLAATHVTVPGDPSSAAFLAVAAALVPKSDIVLESVSLNPTRIGFIEVMRRMGAEIEATVTGGGSEPFGDIRVRYTEDLVGTVVESDLVPSLIDEVPILAVLATAASTPTRFEGVSELRVKESDRLAATIAGIVALGGTAHEDGDDLIVEPRHLTTSACLDPLSDHRLAMSWGVAGLVVEGVEILDPGCVDVSFPGFFDVVATPAQDR